MRYNSYYFDKLNLNLIIFLKTMDEQAINTLWRPDYLHFDPLGEPYVYFNKTTRLYIELVSFDIVIEIFDQTTQNWIEFKWK